MNQAGDLSKIFGFKNAGEEYILWNAKQWEMGASIFLELQELTIFFLPILFLK